MRQKAECTEPIVERDDDNTLFREQRAVVAFFAAKSGEESAAVNPHHHRARPPTLVERRRPDVEIEAILRHTGGEGVDVGVGPVLNAVLSQLLRISNSTPGLGRKRWPPPKRID